LAQAPPEDLIPPPEFAPGMLGDLLLGNRSVFFSYLRASSFFNVARNGATSITNPTVADNNSPEPRDRFSFRYNHFDRSLSVIGTGPAVLGLPGAAPGVPTAPPVTKFYDVDQYTFTVEKTFFDQLMSLEWRVPFRTTLASKLNLSPGRVAGTSIDPATGFTIFDIAETPQDTLGHEDTEWGNMTVILKAKLFQSCRFLVSGGLSVEVPTGQDENILVTDFGGPSTSRATSERFRDFFIRNSTVGLDPFLAFLAKPTNRWFVQGFLQVDIPVNKSGFRYSETGVLATGEPLVGVPATGVTYVNAQPLPINVHGEIADQTLMHADIGTGYLLAQNPCRRWITGIAPTLELHYTTTLENADIVTLPGDFATVINPANPIGPQIQAPLPQIGNLRNRVDILDMTVGTTFFLGQRSTLGLGFAFPLRSNRDDRVFDWEALVQLNYYFGARGASPNVMGRQ
jgi:hypothetical protein